MTAHLVYGPMNWYVNIARPDPSNLMRTKRTSPLDFMAKRLALERKCCIGGVSNARFEAP